MIKRCIAPLTCCLPLCLCPQRTAADAPPNILFIFSDDQAFNTIGSLNNPEVHTPNLDRLVKEGTTFTHAYNPGAWQAAVCVASRTMLMTGAQLWRTHGFKGDHLWPSYMRDAGYETYFTGKWHIKGHPRDHFDHVVGVTGGMPKQTDARYERPFIEGEPDTWSPYDPQFGGYWAGGTHRSESTANNAIQFLNESETKDRPFFMCVAFNAPHDPRQSPKEFVDMYPVDEISVPPNFLPIYPYTQDIAVGRLRDERLAPFPRTEYSIRVNRREYYALITHLDQQIGRILDELQDTGQDRNTYVIFTSDHGLAVGSHGFMGKQNSYDHSIRVPFIIVGPDIPKGVQSDIPIYLQDVMPTTLDLAGVAIPPHVDFKSILAQARGASQERPHEAIYNAYLGAQRTVRTDDYKMIMYRSINKVRLYDMRADPDEMHDLANDPSMRPVMDKLFEQFVRLQAETGDTQDMRRHYLAFFNGN